jgi:hypothetical protein
VREGRLERTRGLGTFAKEPPLVRDLAQPTRCGRWAVSLTPSS